MTKSPKLRLATTAIALAAALLLVVPPKSSARPDSGVTTTFKTLYDDTASNREGHESDLEKQGDKEMQGKNYIEACAKYLAAATEPMDLGNFERARPYLDKMFMAAQKMPVEEQKEMLTVLVEIERNPRARHDGGTDYYKYMAQQRLKLLQTQPGTTARDRFRQVETMAISCSRNKRYGEAETALLECLKELKSMTPVPQEVAWCEQTLARIYDESNDAAAADRYYTESTEFAKQHHDENAYTRALQEHLNSLLKNKMYDKSVLVADEYFKQANSPDEARWRDRVSWVMIARELENANPDLADKYYRAGFDVEKEQTKFAMNMGYGNTIAEWAAMLHRHHKDTEALAVLQEGMNFCRSAKWPDALERYMPAMAKPYEEYLRDANRTKEADEFQASYEREMAAKKISVKDEQDRRLEDEINNPKTKPVMRISALMRSADRAFEEKDCDKAYKQLQTAIDVYEKNADDKDSPRMYGSFRGLRKHLTACGKAEEIKRILLRIVKARMIYGFSDEAFHYSHSVPAPLEDLVPNNVSRPTPDADQIAMLDQLLAEAKSSNKPGNVIEMLNKSMQFKTAYGDKASISEEIEQWTVKEDKPDELFHVMMRTADDYVAAEQFDKASAKCKAAVEVMAKSETPRRNRGSMNSMSLSNLASAFMNKGQLSRAGDCYVAALQLGMDEPGGFSAQQAIKNMVVLAAKMKDANDEHSGEEMLKHALDIVKSRNGEDSTLARTMLLKLATYYAKCGEKEKVKSTCNDLLTSLKKPGMTISDITVKEMDEAAQILQDHACSADGAKLRDQVKLAESQHCVVPAK